MLRNSNSIYFRFNFTVLIKILITEPPFCPFCRKTKKNEDIIGIPCTFTIQI